MKKFSISEAIKFGWETMKGNFAFFVGLLIVAFVIQLIPSWMTDSVRQKSRILWVLFGVISWLLQMIVSMGMLKISLRFCRGEKAELSDLFSCYPLLIRYIIGSMLYGLIVLGGTLLLIVPGIIWAIKYQFYGYNIIDQASSPLQAIKKSGEMTRGAKWDLFLFGLLGMVIMALGLLCLFVGLLAAIPIVMVASAFIYRKLLSQTEAAIETT